MECFLAEMNSILVEAYYSILHMEETALRKATHNQVSISEMHLIECVGKAGKDGITNSAIARELHIKPPSATAAVNKLTQKGYVEKRASSEDGRKVRVVLTPEGKKLDTYHRIYHSDMVRRLEKEFSEEEQVTLIRTVRRLKQFFQESMEEQL